MSREGWRTCCLPSTVSSRARTSSCATARRRDARPRRGSDRRTGRSAARPPDRARGCWRARGPHPLGRRRAVGNLSARDGGDTGAVRAERRSARRASGRRGRRSRPRAGAGVRESPRPRVGQPRDHAVLPQPGVFQPTDPDSTSGATGCRPHVAPVPLEERMDDVRAVMDAVGSEHAVLMGFSEGARCRSSSPRHIRNAQARAGALRRDGASDRGAGLSMGSFGRRIRRGDDRADHAGRVHGCRHRRMGTVARRRPGRHATGSVATATRP